MSMKTALVALANRKSIIAGILVPLICVAAAASTLIDTEPLEGLVRIQVEGTGTGSTNASSGVGKGHPTGIVTYTASFKNANDSLTSNGIGGQCIRGAGTVTLTTKNGTVLSLEQAGLNCNPDAGGGGSDAVVNGAFVVNPTLSTGRYAGATGAGSVVTGQVGATGQAFLTIDGTIKLIE